MQHGAQVYFPESGVVRAAEPRHRPHLDGINIAAVINIGRKVECDDLANIQTICAVAKVHDLVQLAFDMNWRDGDARRRDMHAR